MTEFVLSSKSPNAAKMMQHRFFDLKYNMQHLLARVMNVTSSKASVKFLDGVLRDVES